MEVGDNPIPKGVEFTPLSAPGYDGVASWML